MHTYHHLFKKPTATGRLRNKNQALYADVNKKHTFFVGITKIAQGDSPRKAEKFVIDYLKNANVELYNRIGGGGGPKNITRKLKPKNLFST